MAKYKDIYGNIIEVGNPELNPELIKNKTLVPDTTPLTTNDRSNVITSDMLSPATPINVPPVPTDNTNYQGIIAGGQSLADYFKSLNVAEKPTDLTSMFKDLYSESGLEQKEAKAGESAKALDILQAQMAGLTAEAQATPIRLQEEATGRAITKAGLAPIEAGELRKIALRSLPLQGQILAQQAIATGDQRALEAAQNKFNQVLDIQYKQATLDYEYKKDVRDKIYDYLTTSEKRQLDAIQQKDDRKYEEIQTNKDYASQLIQQTRDSGQPDLAAKIVSLNPESSTYRTELDRLAGQIKAKEEKIGTSIVEVGGRKKLINNQTGETIKDLGVSEVGITEEPEIIIESSSMEDKNRQTILSVLKGAKVGAGTKTKISDALNVMNAVEDLAKVRQTEGFKGISPLNTLLDIKAPQFLGGFGLVPFREALRSKEGAENAGYINAINLKVQQWASGAALTTQQTEQVSKFTPTTSDTDEKVRTKLNNLYNFMLTQVQGNLQSEGIDFKPEKTNLFELYNLIQEASPEQLQQLKDAGLIK